MDFRKNFRSVQRVLLALAPLLFSSCNLTDDTIRGVFNSDLNASAQIISFSLSSNGGNYVDLSWDYDGSSAPAGIYIAYNAGSTAPSDCASATYTISSSDIS
ncbi:MAG: hypothetical protein CL675_08940, partial [Bdellovibrionaceae bacterium]|nr:hypothetical protein [Pseudobdellovibrionaceae bacterium]